ncbi:hypothetical protein BDU57DRAFT_517868 [Ampelomyces quisqualis]|uniref:Uncharacterized protein n=1 Tax=Ampelomyces quisqualis TaxID=50730 RepID=A0A6A5QLZ6_AMPQU|nr:hypothetical protein BDU57DRAFT_517868 [Ampelomyces quisqualis]
MNENPPRSTPSQFFFPRSTVGSNPAPSQAPQTSLPPIHRIPISPTPLLQQRLPSHESPHHPLRKPSGCITPRPRNHRLQAREPAHKHHLDVSPSSDDPTTPDAQRAVGA